MPPALIYCMSMAFTGYIALRLCGSLWDGFRERRSSGWIEFWVMIALWVGALLFVCILMGSMSYGFWTGRWAVRG